MNTLPGFTAEASLYQTGGLYCMATAFNSQNASANVQPAARPSICGVLHKMSWNAYFARNFELVEVLGNAMEGAGCFE